jgi:hypothetical protein
MIKKVETEIKVAGQTAEEFAKFFNSLPTHARITVRNERYYDQRDSGGTWLKATWTETL